MEGRLGKDPEVKTLPSGMVLAEATVATSYKANSVSQKERANDKGYATTWFKLRALGEQAVGSLTDFSKGALIEIIKPRFEEDHYTDKDGNPRQVLILNTWEGVRSAEKPKDKVEAPDKKPETAGTVSGWGKKKAV